MSTDKGICIIGTGTDVGKTVVAAGLAKALAMLGKRVRVIKPVQTGCVPDTNGCLRAPDVAVYSEACPDADTLCIKLFRDACSPHLAAGRENRLLDADALAGEISSVCSLSDCFTIIEGAGGIMVPVNDRETLLDVFSRLDLSVLLVVPNRLGAINHALLSVEALRARGMRVAGFLLTTPGPPPETREAQDLACAIREDNRETIIRMGGLACLAELPHMPELRAREPAARAKGWDRIAAGLLPAATGLLRADPGKEPLPESGSDALLRFDRAHLWHPYTSALAPLTAREAVETRRTSILLRDGTKLVDGMASWWCAIHGYNHPHIINALHRQANRMPHVMFGGITHEPAVLLARRLLGMVPEGLKHVFFSDSGSVSVEVAMKMAVQFHHAAGHPGRSRFLTVRGGYHGDTLGAMSVCDPVTGMHSTFRGVVAEQLFAPRPECGFAAPYDPASAFAFEALLKQEARTVAAVILEPVLQGAGGMWMYHPEYLRRARELCTEYGCLLILDEIATGFGRTGKLFACEWAGIEPDIMCLGKALTGGVVTLAATLATARVAEGISRNGGVLMHGPTFMANPLACAAAGASLDLIEDGSWRNRVQRIEAGLRAGLAPCGEFSDVADVRVLGAVGVVEMRREINVEKFQAYCVNRHGVWIRPFGRNIYVMPPYVIAETELMRITSAMRGAVEEGVWE